MSLFRENTRPRPTPSRSRTPRLTSPRSDPTSWPGRLKTESRDVSRLERCQTLKVREPRPSKFRH